MSEQRNESSVLPRADRAFALWCAEQHMVEDRTAPHGEAFYAGFCSGYEEGYRDAE